MTTHPLEGSFIRTGVLRFANVGFILACDPQKEEDGIAHTIIYTWDTGTFYEGEANFDANSCCIIKEPEPGFVITAGSGGYSVHTRNGETNGNIFQNSHPKPEAPRYGDFRSVSEIGGKAHAVGLRGMVYRLDVLSDWTRIDQGLPGDFNIQAIHGMDASDLYAVGRKGEIWHFDGSNWSKEDLPTNVNLTTVKCVSDGTVYLGGHDGILIRGGRHSWELVEHGETTDDIWGLEWFGDQLYVSTMSSLYRLEGDELKQVDFDDDEPDTTYQLSAIEDIMWSIGREDIMAYDGKTWTRIV
ncbi:MAG: hypothetical protein GY737_19525 [Desulfobacteraceae bacterium]|nr:hypothetical protein [Desulfobacteraceae bacterium]